MSRNGSEVPFALLLLTLLSAAHQVVGLFVPEYPNRNGESQHSEMMDPPWSGPVVPWRPRPQPQRTPLQCACDQRRLDGLDESIAGLLNRMSAQEAKSVRTDAAARRLSQEVRQLKSQVTQVTSENQRLSRQVRSLRSESSSLQAANRRLQGDNRQLSDERDRLRDALEVARDQAGPARPVDVGGSGPQQQPRSSAQELLEDDVVGNREAEMMEMGLFTAPSTGQDQPPAQAGRPDVYSRRPPFQSDRLASSLLVLNRENDVLSRKIARLEERMDDQSVAAADPAARIHSVPGPPSSASREVAEQISELERLVLVALQAPRDEGHYVMSARPVPSYGRLGAPPQPGSSGPSGSSRMAPRVESMNDEDLDALVNVVDRVQNKSPRKSAFSVASTKITKGSNGEPKTIEFDHQYVNKGGDFKKSSNSFVCEYPGFYYMTFTLRSYDGKYLGVVLMKNDEPQTAVYADSGDRNIMQSQSVVLQLQPGDHVYLRHAPSESFAVHSGDHKYITFSGFLLYRGN